MKKLFSVFVIFCWLSQSAFSQIGPKRPMAGALETYKIGFITNRLQLSPEEAQKFWPIYRLYTNEVRQAYAANRSNPNELQLEEILLNIKKKYSVEFLKAIPPPKINDFFNVEKEFNIMVQREMQRRQMQGRPFPQ